MTLGMSQQLKIRQEHLAGKPITKIALEEGLDPKTVRKYAYKDNFSPQAPKRHQRSFPSLAEYVDFIDGLLEEDKKSWRKQKLTAQRIWDLARENGCTASLSTVQRYVKDRRSQMGVRAEQMLELCWHPGEAQVDFGQVDVDQGGTTLRCRFLVVSFPYSNMAYTQLFRGEDAQCVCQGLIDVFTHIGGVPTRLIFDNATGVGRRRGQVVTETELFARLRTHFGFDVTFCNPASGNEKGNVETKVGFLRRNLFTPMIEVTDLEGANQGLLTACESLQNNREHYRKARLTKELFAEDIQALRELPNALFEAVSYQHLRADKWGGITINTHHYSGNPTTAREEVLVRIGAHHVWLLNPHTHQVYAKHLRARGPQPTSSVDVVTQIKALSFKPRGWRNSHARELLPTDLVAVLDDMQTSTRKSALFQLGESMSTAGIDATLTAFSNISIPDGHVDGNVDFMSVAALAARIAGFGINAEPLPGPDLSVYDGLVKIS